MLRKETVMADNFKYNDPDSNENGLKEADAEKSENKTSDGQSAQEIFGSKFMSNSLSVNARKDSRKRNFPIIVDIVIGILILAIFAGAVVGAYYLFRYYSDDYSGAEIKYTVIVPCEDDLMGLRTMKGRALYLDTEDNTYYFGTVSDVILVENAKEGNYAVMIVSINARFRADEGYTVSGNRIAVGCNYSLRSDSMILDATVVELALISGGK